MTTATLTKIELTSEQVKQLQAASKALKTKDYLVNIQFQDNKILVFNHNNTVIFNLDSNIEDPFMISPESLEVFKKLKVKKNDSINITVDNNSQATFSINNIDRKIGIELHNKLNIPKLKNEKNIAITDNYIQSVYDAITFTAKLETRPVLTMIYHHNNSIVVTDSHRLFKKENIFTYDNNFLLSPITVKVLYKLFKKSNVSAFIDKDNGLIKYQSNNITVMHRLSDHNYPDIDRILPEHFKTTLTVNKEELTEILSQAAKNTMTIFNIKDNNIDLTINDHQSSNILLKSNIDTNKTGEDIKITFNTQYMIDTLKQMKDNSVTVNINSEVTPMTITDSENYHLLLPIKRA